KRAQLVFGQLNNRRPVKMTVPETRNYMTRDNQMFSDAPITPTEQLVQIHLEAMEAFRDILKNDHADISMFVSPPPVAERSTFWVEHYYDKKGPEDFYPHFTLGQGKVQQLSEPFQFYASRLALA